jgi:hypothetical protein
LQIDFITDDVKVLEETANKLGWKLSEKKSMFLIQGDGPPNAIGEVLGPDLKELEPEAYYDCIARKRLADELLDKACSLEPGFAKPRSQGPASQSAET